jgi:phage FluMu protein Com
MVTIRCPHCDEPVDIDLEEAAGDEIECPECFEPIENLDELAELEADEDIVDLDFALDGEFDGRLGRHHDRD